MVVEDDRRKHVAVLGDRERRHLQLRRFVEQLVDAAGAVEQRELGVQMKMDELDNHAFTGDGDSPSFPLDLSTVGFDEMS